MRIRVTKGVSKLDRDYRVGDIIDNPTSRELSMRRLYKWDILDDPTPTLQGLRKPQLVDLAAERGVDVEGLTKAEIVEALGG